jgi:hypothetical protein
MLISLCSSLSISCCASNMTAFIFVTFLCLFTTVWDGGYQGCLERVWLYQALVIDHKINDEASRTIGMQCKGRDWDGATHVCARWQLLVGFSTFIVLGKRNYERNTDMSNQRRREPKAKYQHTINSSHPWETHQEAEIGVSSKMATRESHWT